MGQPKTTWDIDWLERVQERSRDRERLTLAFEHHVLTPDCKTCRDDFDAVLAEYREKYA